MESSKRILALPDRIKLTEEDFDEWVGCDKSLQYTIHVTELGKQLILENQEKAEKWDKHLKMMVNAENCVEQIMEDNTKLEQQNKQLKEDNQDTCSLLMKENFGKTPKACLDLLLHEFKRAKEKVEKIEKIIKFAESHHDNVNIFQIKEILEIKA